MIDKYSLERFYKIQNLDSNSIELKIDSFNKNISKLTKKRVSKIKDFLDESIESRISSKKKEITDLTNLKIIVSSLKSFKILDIGISSYTGQDEYGNLQKFNSILEYNVKFKINSLISKISGKVTPENADNIKKIIFEEIAKKILKIAQDICTV